MSNSPEQIELAKHNRRNDAIDKFIDWFSQNGVVISASDLRFKEEVVPPSLMQAEIEAMAQTGILVASTIFSQQVFELVPIVSALAAEERRQAQVHNMTDNVEKDRITSFANV